MGNKIKEILDYLKIENGTIGSELSYEETHLLLDYITNLQQENETRQQDINNLTYQLAKMKKENERLKETNVYCNRTDCVGRIKDSRKYDSVYQEKEDYKSRCEKVSEIIEKEKANMGYAKYDSCLLLIENIIKNGSDNK